MIYYNSFIIYIIIYDFFTRILKKTNTLVFLFCELKCNDKIITSASGIWKILKIKPSDLGPGG